MPYVLNHDFHFFAYQNITKFVESFILNWSLWYIKSTYNSYLFSLF